jgi:hypothetical protein
MYTNATFETWPCDLCVNIYSIYIYIYKCMYVCICICTHVNVCHVYIVCHLQKLAAAAKRRSLPLDHLSQLSPPLISHHHLGPHVRQPRFPHHIIRHETKESMKTKGSLGEKCFWREKIVTSNWRELTSLANNWAHHSCFPPSPTTRIYAHYQYFLIPFSLPQMTLF